MTVYPDLLGSPLVGYDPDAVLAAVEAVRSYCGWHIAPSVEETVILDGCWARRLYLPSLHVTSVGEIIENGLALDVSSYTVKENGILRRPFGFWWGYEDTVVTFTHGYEDCPLDVRAVVASLAKGGLTSSAGGDSVQVGQVRVAGAATRGALGLDLTTTATLDRYRIIR